MPNVYEINLTPEMRNRSANEAFYSHQSKSHGLASDFGRNSAYPDTSDNRDMRLGLELFDKNYANYSTLKDEVKLDLKAVLPKVDQQIYDAVLTNQAQGRGINNDVGHHGFGEEGKTIVYNNCLRKVVFQDIVPSDDNNSVTFTELSLQHGNLWVDTWALADREYNESTVSYADVSFLEERSYTYAWVDVKEEIKKNDTYKSDYNTHTNDLLQAIQGYAKGDKSLEDLCTHIFSDFPGSDHAHKFFPEEPKGGDEFSLWADGTGIANQKNQENKNRKEYTFIYMENKWIPQFRFTNEFIPRSTGCRLKDGKLAIVSTTNHSSSIQMVCDRKEARNAKNKRLGLLGHKWFDPGPKPLIKNVSTFHLYLKFMTKCLDTMNKGDNYSQAYTRKKAADLLNCLTEISDGTYLEPTKNQRGGFSLFEAEGQEDLVNLSTYEKAIKASQGSLSKELQAGGHEVQALRAAFIKARLDPAEVDKVLPATPDNLGAKYRSFALGAVGAGLFLAATVVIFLFPPAAVPLIAAVVALGIGVGMVTVAVRIHPMAPRVTQHNLFPPVGKEHTSSIPSSDIRVATSEVKNEPQGAYKAQGADNTTDTGNAQGADNTTDTGNTLKNNCMGGS